MKLKGLPQRAYNILFHTHTVAGIVISFALFIIFYAGSFAIFRHDIYRWENPQARIEVTEEVDMDRLMESITKSNPNFLIEEPFTIRLPEDNIPFIQFFGTEHHAGEDHNHRFSALINPNTYEYTSKKDPITTVGDTIYHLHYFRQIPFGLYISGFVSLFFLFATVTGVLIHWRNIVTKFYAFTFKGKWKQIWTNMHTVLGVIGLPFQIMYAVTGALFGLLTLLLVPSAFVLFGGDTDAILNTVRPEGGIKADSNAVAYAHLDIDHYVDKIKQDFPGYAISNMRVNHHGKEDAWIIFYIDDHKTINGTGQVTYRMKDEKILSISDPNNKTYAGSVLNSVTKLHFATFGGWGLKILYFILGILTAFMILSGVLLWEEARNNNRYTEKQKRFHHRVTNIYLAICLGLFPATAIIFLANKLIPLDLAGRATYVNTAFFMSWLLLIIVGLFWKSHRQLNKNYMLIGGLISLFIPIANGTTTGDWFWNSDLYVMCVDVFWIITGITALSIFYYIKVKDSNNVNVEQEVVKMEEVVMA